MTESFRALQIEKGGTLCAYGLRLARPLQRPLNRGQGVRGVDEREGAQGEGVGHEAGEEIRAHLALARARFGLDDPEQTGRHARAVPCVFQEHEVLRFAQLDLDGQRLGGRHGGADNSMPLIARQPVRPTNEERIQP